MNARARLFISILLLGLTLGLGIAFTRHPESTTFAVGERPPYEFTGPIMALPDDTLGTWQVGTTAVLVDRKTQVDETAGRVQVGTWVRVRATEEGNTLRAEIVRVLPPQNVPASVDIHGIVRKARGDIWNISGRQVRVTANTRIIGNVDPADAVAMVRGHMEGTTLVADVILLSSATEEANRVEFIGRLDEVRGDVWVVDGVEVRAPEGVAPPPLGSMVSVRGQMVDTRSVVAERLAVDETPPTFIEGWLVEGGSPGHTWRVLVANGPDNRSSEIEVEVPSDTPVDEREGLARPGARVQIVATNTDDRVTASFARVLESSYTYLTGTLVYIPEDPYAFPWTVDKTQVWVRPNTVTDRPLDAFRLGDRVGISGLRQPDGTLVARMISRSKR